MDLRALYQLEEDDPDLSYRAPNAPPQSLDTEALPGFPDPRVKQTEPDRRGYGGPYYSPAPREAQRQFLYAPPDANELPPDVRAALDMDRRVPIADAAMQSAPAWHAQAAAAGMDPDQVYANYLQAINRAQLSPGEQRRAQEIQNGLDTIQARIQDGTFSPAQGAMLQAEYRQMALPYEIRRSQLPLLQYQMQQFQYMQAHARQAMLDSQAQAYQARGAQDRVQTIQTHDGRTLQYLTDGRGNLHQIPDHTAQQQARDLQNHSNVIDSIRREVLQEWERAHSPQAVRERADRQRRSNFVDDRPEWMSHSESGPFGNVSPVDRRINELIDQHYRHLGIARPNFGGNASPSAPQAQQPSLRPFDVNARPQDLAPPQQAVLQESQERARQIEALPQAQRAPLLADNQLVTRLVAQRGTRNNMTASERDEYDRARARIVAALSGQAAPTSRIPTNLGGAGGARPRPRSPFLPPINEELLRTAPGGLAD